MSALKADGVAAALEVSSAIAVIGCGKVEQRLRATRATKPNQALQSTTKTKVRRIACPMECLGASKVARKETHTYTTLFPDSKVELFLDNLKSYHVSP